MPTVLLALSARPVRPGVVHLALEQGDPLVDVDGGLAHAAPSIAGRVVGRGRLSRFDNTFAVAPGRARPCPAVPAVKSCQPSSTTLPAA